MRKNIVLGCLLLCSSWSLAQAQVDSLAQVVASDTLALISVKDSTFQTQPDSLLAFEDTLALDSVEVSDSIVAFKEVDSTAVALRPLTQIDSTTLVLEQVKALTDKISAQSLLNAHLVQQVFSDTAVVNKYNRLLDRMVEDYATEIANISAQDSAHVNPLYFRLFAPLTLYKSPVSQVMALETYPEMSLEDSLRLSAMVSGKDIRLLNELDRVLLSTYLASPALVELTEKALMESQSVSEEALKKAAENVKLDVPSMVTAPVVEAKSQVVTDMVVQKPNFWVTKGSFSTQMTESYFSPNWYQGGINNINLLSMLTLEANYDNKRKVQWSNKLDARLGFYQNQGEEIQSNQDLLRLTSKLNLKAIRNWNYTIEAQGNTQMMNHYSGSGDDKELQSRFLAPADVSLTIGMDFKKSFSRGSISIYPGPLSYKMTYVANPALSTKYGLEEGQRMRSDLGSKLEVNFDYKITENISYKTRFYYFTGRYEYVQMDWENTLNFQVSKYISTKLFFHVRYDDLVEPYEGWKYFQFKQYLMLGLNYAW